MIRLLPSVSSQNPAVLLHIQAIANHAAPLLIQEAENRAAQLHLPAAEVFAVTAAKS